MIVSIQNYGNFSVRIWDISEKVQDFFEIGVLLCQSFNQHNYTLTKLEGKTTFAIRINFVKV